MTDEKKTKKIPGEIIRKPLKKSLPVTGPKTGEKRSRSRGFPPNNKEYMQQNPHRDSENDKNNK